MKIIIIAINSLIILIGLNACSTSGQLDRVAQGSLTLTPLLYPDGLQKPVADRSAFGIPETIDPKDMKVVDSNPLPPEIDLAKANAEIKKSKPVEPKQHNKAGLLLVSVIKQTPSGHQFLLVTSNFDRLWEGMDGILAELGFKVEDRNRSKQTFYVYREIAKTKLQVQEEKDTGVERELGNRESYQIYLQTQDATHTAVSTRNQVAQDDDSALAKLLLVQIKSVLEQPIK